MLRQEYFVIKFQYTLSLCIILDKLRECVKLMGGQVGVLII